MKRLNIGSSSSVQNPASIFELSSGQKLQKRPLNMKSEKLFFFVFMPKQNPLFVSLSKSSNKTKTLILQNLA